MYTSIVCLRVKTCKVNQLGEIVPPAVDDTTEIVYQLDDENLEILLKKKEELLGSIKKWLDKP